MRISVLLLVFVLLAACSGIKQPGEPQNKQDADAMFQLAVSLENAGKSEQAKESYNCAMQLYKSHAGIEGQLACLSGLGRLHITAKNDASYVDILSEMKGLIKEIAPELEYHVLLLNLFALQNNKDYDSIAKLAYPKQAYPLYVNLQLASAKLQADAYLKLATPGMASELDKMATKYRKQVIKKPYSNPELLSAAWYALAYYHYLNHDYNQALEYLVSIADWDYRHGNNSGLGHAYWLRGQVEIAQQHSETALASLRKAEIIFGAINDIDALRAVAQEITRLKGEKP